MTTYKTELFSLCKSLSDIQLTHDIISMKSNLHEEDSFFDKSMWFSTTRDVENHFYGVLLGNSEYNILNNDLFIAKIPRLNKDELKVCKRGNEFLNKVYKELINKLYFLPSTMKLALNPYLRLRRINERFYESINIDETDCIDVTMLVNCFSKSYIVECLIDQFNDIPKDALLEFSLEEVFHIFERFNKDIEKCGYDKVPNDLLRIKMNGCVSLGDKLTNFFFTLYAIKEIIELTISTLYSALNGYRLHSLTNENLINFNGSTENMLCTKYKFSTVSKANRKTFPRISNLCIIDAKHNSKEDSKIKCLVVIISITTRFGRKITGTETMEALEVDDSLNRYYSYFEK